MSDSKHWAPEASIYARGCRIMSRDIVETMQAQQARWQRLNRWAWNIARWFRKIRGLPANGMEGRA